jgi:hypothetical protein
VLQGRRDLCDKPRSPTERLRQLDRSGADLRFATSPGSNRPRTLLGAPSLVILPELQAAERVVATNDLGASLGRRNSRQTSVLEMRNICPIKTTNAFGQSRFCISMRRKLVSLCQLQYIVQFSQFI